MHNESSPTDNASPNPTFQVAPLFGFALALTMVAAIGAYAVRNYSPRKAASDCYEQQEGDQPVPYTKWQKPLVAVVLSGQMHGFYDKCGCSDPQFGGLPRRYNFIQSLKAKNWDVVGVDLGEVADFRGIQKQNLFKYELSMRALGVMNYRAVGIGRDEFLMGLGEGLVQVEDDRKPFPRPLNLNLQEAVNKGEYYKLNARQWEIIDHKNAKMPKIGVISLMGPDVRDELKPLGDKFLTTEKELPIALKAFADAGVEIGIILHHEYPAGVNKFPAGIAAAQFLERERRDLAAKALEYCDAARKKNKKIPPIQLMMVLTDQSEPSAVPRKIGPNTDLIEIGHKGRYVGLIGVYRDDKKGYRLKYEMVMMSPEWETKDEEKKAHPILALMEEYNNNLKREKILDKIARTPHFNQVQPQGVAGLKATYVGSDACVKCHKDAIAVWQKTPHFKATETLEGLKNPSGRQYDPECMMCHTTGLKHPGGYNDLVTNLTMWPRHPAPKPNDLAQHNNVLRGVGCESCHGPGSEHVAFPARPAIHKAINPYRLTNEERNLEELADKKTPAQKQRHEQLFNGRMLNMAQSLCTKCHDQENDVNWGKPGKDTADKWHGLVHRLPKNNNGGVIAPPAQPLVPPVIQNDAPPLVIEIFQDKKK